MKQMNGKRLLGRTILITGASSGIGEAVAYRAAAEGAVLLLGARNETALSAVAAKCRQLSDLPADFHKLDVGDPASVSAFAAWAQASAGVIDGLVNSAGFGYFAEFTKIDFEMMRKMIEVDLLGTMYMTRVIAEMMIAAGRGGHIINTASQAGKIATPKSTVYSAAKFGVIGFSNALRLELLPLGIRVTTVNLGPVATSFFQIADPTGTYLNKMKGIALDPAKLAKKIVRALTIPRREINAPKIMAAADVLYALFPQIGDQLAGKVFNKK